MPSRTKQFINSLVALVIALVLGMIALASLTYVAGEKLSDTINKIPAVFTGER